MSILGAISGDIMGSLYERKNEKSYNVELFNKESSFTDDTILTIAIADAILNNIPYKDKVHEYGNKYPKRGYGGSFTAWLHSDGQNPYDSWGNGSAMRVSPISYAYTSFDEVLEEAKKSAEITHNHPDGIIGAQAIATATYMAFYNFDKTIIKMHIEQSFGYNLNFTIEDIREDYKFDVSCKGSVPQAIVAYLQGKNFIDIIRLAISIGGDSDTIAAMAGSIAAAQYKIPKKVKEFVYSKIPQEFITIIETFDEKYGL